MSTEISGYDFLDLGCSPDSMGFAMRSLGGKRGLGVDISETRVPQMAQANLDFLRADITTLEMPERSVRFISMSHVLEHLPGRAVVKQVLANALRTATDFLFICGPCFDPVDYLKDLGLKLYWADWDDHCYHLTTLELRDILQELGAPAPSITGYWDVVDSTSPSVHPLASPRNQNEYDANRHPPKPFVRFERRVCQEFACYVPLRPLPNFADLVRSRHGCLLLEPYSQTDLLLLQQEGLIQRCQGLQDELRSFPSAPGLQQELADLRRLGGEASKAARVASQTVGRLLLQTSRHLVQDLLPSHR